MRSPFPAAIVLCANDFQFTRHDHVYNPQVYSRMLLWCKVGTGRVVVGGVSHDLNADDFLFMPWEHSICYTPDKRHPFLVAGVHIIPVYPRRTPVVYSVKHRASDKRAAGINDMRLPHITGVMRGSFTDTPALRDIAEYTVRWFQRDNRDEWIARYLGQTMLAEIVRVFSPVKDTGQHMPDWLRQVRDHIRRNLTKRMRVDDLAGFARCSASTLTRACRRYLAITPTQLINQERITRAQHLLASTRLPIAVIGARVGIDDPYYFSKLFRRFSGQTARAYRQRASLV